MILPDVNVLIYCLRGDAERHREYRKWLDASLKSGLPILLADVVTAGVARVATHPRVWRVPTPLDDVIGFLEGLRSRPNVRPAQPGRDHWGHFARLCRAVHARGNLVADAWLAAITLEQGSTLFTTDRDFAKFPGLRWRHPLEE